MTIQEMIARQQEIVSGARAAGRDLTAEEQREFDELQRKITEAGNPAGGEGGQPGEGNRGAGNPGQDEHPGGEDPSDAARQAAVLQERQRISDIVSLCRQTGMDPGQYINNGASMDTCLLYTSCASRWILPCKKHTQTWRGAG